jgi:hypothetical protein
MAKPVPHRYGLDCGDAGARMVDNAMVMHMHVHIVHTRINLLDGLLALLSLGHDLRTRGTYYLVLIKVFKDRTFLFLKKIDNLLLLFWNITRYVCVVFEREPCVRLC